MYLGHVINSNTSNSLIFPLALCHSGGRESLKCKLIHCTWSLSTIKQTLLKPLLQKKTNLQIITETNLPSVIFFLSLPLMFVFILSL